MSTSPRGEAAPLPASTLPPDPVLAESSGALPLPEGVETNHWVWPYIGGVGIYHLLLPLAFLPWFFSWTGVALAIIGLYVYGTLGINLCYHRILTHKGLTVPKWLERTFATLGVCCLEDTPARWIAVHRLHHQYSDEQRDPHSPRVTLLWSHMFWLFVTNRDTAYLAMYERYANDVLKDPYYLGLERHLGTAWLNALQWFVYFAAGFGAGWFMYGNLTAATQFGVSVWLWGVVVRTVAVWHITWSVNSLSHRWGYQTYDTGDDSRNNWFVAWISNGEGWHNNHHADQRAAAHGHKWWEFDVTWLTVRLLERLGLATDVVRPKVWERPAR